MTQHRQIDLLASLNEVSSGGIPLRARERLADTASRGSSPDGSSATGSSPDGSSQGPGRKLFTSDLSVSEYLLARDAVCEPISQVMGSSIFHVGQIPDYKGATSELTVIGDAHRESRRAAMSRLFQEAALIGADAVIGVRLRDRMITMGSRGKGGDDGGEVLEFTVVGTAVRAPWITHAPGQPVVTDLSGKDLWALAQDGFEPCGFLFEFCRYHVWHATKGFSGFTGEINAASQAVEEARSIAANKLLAQADKFQAEFVVGSDFALKVREVPCGYRGCQLDDMDVDVSWFGTAIRRIPNVNRDGHQLPPLVLSMMPLGRRAEAEFDVDDDQNDVEVAAEEAEEAALEADEAAGES